MANPKKPDNAPVKPVEGQWGKDAPEDPQAFVKRSLPAARERGEVKEMARGIERRDARLGELTHAMQRIADLTEMWEDSLISQVNQIAHEALQGGK